MNPRQRRGVLLMVLAALGAVVVFTGVLSYVGSVRAEVGVKTEVLRVKEAVPAFTQITPANLEPIWVPKKWSPTTMITDKRQLEGMVAATDIPAGAHLQAGMIAPGPSTRAGQREIAIMIDAETGVAGRVRKGMAVDIYATYTKRQGTQNQESCAARIVKSALVTQIGQVTKLQDEKNNTVTTEALPITFALSAADSLKLTREESFANKIRLALIGGSGKTPDGVELPPVCETVPAK